MRRHQAIRTIIKSLNGDEAVVSSTGLMSRELFNVHDNPQNFYMTGSMGLASSIGLGIVKAQPKRKVVIIEGDCSLLMNLGSLATIGHFRSSNLLHIVLDNNAYGSCSGERSISTTANLEGIARLTGYKEAITMNFKNSYFGFTKNDLKNLIQTSLVFGGPVLLVLKISDGGRRDLPRPLELKKLTNRFRNFLTLNQKK